MYYPNSVQYADTFFLLGGQIEDKKDSDAIYRYEPETGHWSLIPYRMSSPAWRFAAFAVNRDAFKN